MAAVLPRHSLTTEVIGEKGHMRLQSETGKSKASGLLWLLLFVILGWATWNIAPVYFANWTFKDKMRDLAHAHPSIRPDAVIHADLMKEARDRGIADYLGSCDIKSTESSRRIICEYTREVQVLPGIKHRFHFRNDVNERYF
jgi:hypothetical protein